MSRFLSELLSADYRALSRCIERLEKVNLYPGVDVRLTVDIKRRIEEKLDELSLNPKDTTPRELFISLQTKIIEDEKKLYGLFSGSDKDVHHSLVQAAMTYSDNEKVLAMSQAALKRLLVELPPRKTMKLLKFRSIEAVTKRQNPSLLYAVAAHYEDASWRNQVTARIKRLNSRDIVVRPVSYDVLPLEWVGKLKKTGLPKAMVISNSEAGTVVLMPFVDEDHSGSLILAVSLLFQTGHRLAIESMPHRMQSFIIGYQQALPKLAEGPRQTVATIHGLEITWYALFEYLVRTQDLDLISDYDLMLGDIEWSTTAQKLALLAPELTFWLDTHFLGVPVASSKPVSFHIVDNAATLAARLDYQEHLSSHMQASLWNELQIRYLQTDVMRQALRKQLTQSLSSMV
jgi:hypothetical protein